MISLHKLHCHVHYGEVYQYKSFQKFSMRTLIRIACPNVKNKQKRGLNTLRVKFCDHFGLSASFHSSSLMKIPNQHPIGCMHEGLLSGPTRL